MDHDQIQSLADRIERASGPDLELAVAALGGLAAAVPQATGQLRPGVVDSTDAVLHLVASALPSWSVKLEGTAREPGSRWTCTLRQSGARDDEEVIGIGRAPTPPLALIAALLRVRIIQERGYK